MSAKKLVLVLLLAAVAVAAGITISNLVDRCADWLPDNIEPGPIASGAAQAYLGNAAHAVTTCGAVQTGQWTTTCWATGTVVILIVLVLIRVFQQASKRRLTQIQDRGDDRHQLLKEEIRIMVLEEVRQDLTTAVINGLNMFRLQPQPVYLLPPPQVVTQFREPQPVGVPVIPLPMNHAAGPGVVV